MSRQSWWPNTLANQAAVAANILAKIDHYAATLGWTPAQVTAVKTLCEQIIAAYNYVDGAKATMQAATQWRELVYYGEPMGTNSSPIPEFGTAPDMTFVRGCVTQLSKYREQIMGNLNYTDAIGEDLMLVGPEQTPPNPATTEPILKITKSNETPLAGTDSIVITGSMSVASAVKIMYTPKGGVPREVGFFTSMPATVVITKTNPNEPESGTIQAQYYKKNLPFGNPSPNYNVTLV